MGDIYALKSVRSLSRVHAGNIITSTIRVFRSIPGSLLVVGPSIRRSVLLLGWLTRGNLRSRLQRWLLLRLHLVRLHLVQGVALSLSDSVHREQVDLQVLLGLKLLVAHVARDVLGLHGVNVDDVLLQIGIVRVYLAALGTLGLAGVVGVIHLMLLVVPPLRLLLMKHRHTLNLVLRAGLQHQIQLIALSGTALLKALEVVLQFLMHHRQLLCVEAVEGVEGIEGVLLRRLLAGGMVMMVLMMMVMLEESREVLTFRVVTTALISSRPGVFVPSGGCTRQPTGTRA